MLGDNLYTNLDSTFTMFDLDCGAQKGHLACCLCWRELMVHIPASVLTNGLITTWKTFD